MFGDWIMNNFSFEKFPLMLLYRGFLKISFWVSDLNGLKSEHTEEGETGFDQATHKDLTQDEATLWSWEDNQDVDPGRGGGRGRGVLMRQEKKGKYSRLTGQQKQRDKLL